MKKKAIKRTLNILSSATLLTIGLPLLFFLALGYWAASDDDVSFWEAFKRCI